MNALLTSLAALAVIIGGGFCGVMLRRVLPEHHLSDDTKDVVRLGTGLIGTMAALVLGLLIAAANSSFETQSGHVQHMAADVILLDELLAQYGAEATPSRGLLRQAVDPLIEAIWHHPSSSVSAQTRFSVSKPAEVAFAKIEQLSPQNDAQRIIKDRAIQTGADLAQTRLLLFEQAGGTLPLPFLIVLVFWLALIFASFGMFSRFNPTLAAALILFAVSASGALFLVLELNQPFAGLMEISSAPLRNALAPL